MFTFGHCGNGCLITRISPSKCEFRRHELKVLGCHVSARYVHTVVLVLLKSSLHFDASSPIDFSLSKVVVSRSPVILRLTRSCSRFVASLKKWQSMVSDTYLYIFIDHKPLIDAFKSRKERFSPRQHAPLFHHLRVRDRRHPHDALSRVVDSASDQSSVDGSLSVDAFDLQA
jgi:hypothetical protein